jgi:23S rRNA (cytosine1962-C5)-methyltransferase
MDSGYELLDCGDGRRLERFGERIVDRPAPGATDPRRDPGIWADAISYRAGRGWAAADGLPGSTDDEPVELAGIRLLASLAAGGQVGVFPEHARNAAWVRAAVARRTPALGSGDGPAPTVLNLFAYTGLLTLVAAGGGAAVTHVDASRPAVQWARRNAEANGMADRPIRWIADDALSFLRREARRGRSYQGLILDPPSYGHGGEGGHAGAFRFERDIVELLAAARAVATPDAFWLLSTHTIGWDVKRIAAALAAGTAQPIRAVVAVPLDLTATSRARLALGAAARFDPLDVKPR